MKTAHWHLHVDGASRNNPGPSGAGVYLTKGHQVIFSHGFFLGTKTNNQAEYLALLIGLIITIPKIGADHLRIVSDSQLLINQINGIYRVKHPNLINMYQQIMTILRTISYDAVHVLRANNQMADEMANLGIDQKIAISTEIKEKLKQYDVEI